MKINLFVFIPKSLSPSCLAALLFILSFYYSSCKSEPDPPVAPPVPEIKETKTGLASFYGLAFEGQKTTSGEIFHSKEMVAAHPSYPFGTVVRVTNLENNDTVQVRIIDRGPTAVNRKEGVIIDISKGAAEKLKMITDGRVRVQVDVLEWGVEEGKEDSLQK